MIWKSVSGFRTRSCAKTKMEHAIRFDGNGSVLARQGLHVEAGLDLDGRVGADDWQCEGQRAGRHLLGAILDGQARHDVAADAWLDLRPPEEPQPRRFGEDIIGPGTAFRLD